MRKALALALVLAAFAGVALLRGRGSRGEELMLVPVERRDIVGTVRATGTVEPKNLVPVRAPVGGRIERLQAEPGARVRKGDLLAEMSSSERASVLDEALAQGATVYQYWLKFYRRTPVVTPVGGLVINREVVEGQAVRPGEPLFTIADELVVRAEVDETDIARIQRGQNATIRADAFPDQPFEAMAVSVGLQAKQVEGVSMYTVELWPAQRPDGLKTGMTAEVVFVVESKRGVLALPAAAVKAPERSLVRLLAVPAPGAAPALREVQLGLSDGKSVEVVSGLGEGAAVLVPRPSPRAPE